MTRLWKALQYARRLLWFLELLVNPRHAAEALLSHPRVARWLDAQPLEDQRKIRDAAPLVIAALLASLDR